MTNEEYMKLALEEAELSVREGNVPFAVVVVDESGEVIHKDHDRVKELMDPTAHGEVNAIRFLCKEYNTLSLNNLTFYTTSGPCPTCLTAMIKAQVPKCFYGAPTQTSASLPISAAYIASLSKKHPIEVVGGILKDDALAQRDKYI